MVAVMSIWGKLAGAAAGYAFGGPIGALVGALAGHFGVDRPFGDAGSGSGTRKNEVAFTIGVIALGAKMAKADGVVSPVEVAAFKEVFRVPGREVPNVARVFDLAKQDVAGFESYAEQLASLFHDNRGLLEDVLEGLFHIALADRVLHPKEEEYLRAVSERFGFSTAEFRAIRARFVTGDQSDPYVVLGLPATASMEDIKARYRKLMRENHPDKAIARGMPPEFIKIANDKVAGINAAYQRIVTERGGE
jgi:DnaJ like chaperone protein